jgi:C4-dicarboxylate transporter DctQ subunit
LRKALLPFPGGDDRVSFTQVVARYGFNSGWGGALEFTRILFAWLILFGMSYGIKIGAHLGVDAAIRLFPRKTFPCRRRVRGPVRFAYAVILLYSDWLQVCSARMPGAARSTTG